MNSIPASAIVSWRTKPIVPKTSKPRQRKFGPKTRNGCITCKSRRVKCTEETPACSRCIKAGFPCAGYDVPKAWLFETSNTSAQSCSDGENLGTVAINPSTKGLVSSTEQRALGYWLDRTQSELTAFTYTAAQLWLNLVPQLFQSNPTIRSAIVAVSTLHEDTRSRRLVTRQASTSSLFLKHYTKAVRDLTRLDDAPSREVILISCLIFMACENLCESIPGFILHLQSGLKVLREWRTSRRENASSTHDPTFDMIFNLLEPVFARLEAQTSVLPTENIHTPDFRAYDLHWKPAILPNRFDNFFDARNGLHDIIQHMWFQAQGEVIIAGTEVYRNFLYNMTAWDIAFKRSLPRYDDPTWPHHKAALALRLHQRTLMLAVRNEASPDPFWMDKHENQVVSILNDAEEVVVPGKPTVDMSEYGYSNIWDYDFDIQPVLVMLSIFCRHPSLRRRAIHLMRLQHCWWNQLKFYKACMLARIVELVMEVEERGLSATSLSSAAQYTEAPAAPYLPLSHRIRPELCQFGDPNRVSLEYTHLYSSGPSTPFKIYAPIFPETATSAVVFDDIPSPMQQLRTVKLSPLSEMVKHGVTLGLFRPVRNHCKCTIWGIAVPKSAQKEEMDQKWVNGDIQVSYTGGLEEVTCRQD